MCLYHERSCPLYELENLYCCCKLMIASINLHWINTWSWWLVSGSFVQKYASSQYRSCKYLGTRGTFQHENHLFMYWISLIKIKQSYICNGNSYTDIMASFIELSPRTFCSKPWNWVHRVQYFRMLFFPWKQGFYSFKALTRLWQSAVTCCEPLVIMKNASNFNLAWHHRNCSM